MPVVGTAGHVDHGKSTLILAITGRDPDRWEEEKRRGLTIDLGFAWTTLPDGTEVSFVDVPGHERFIKNMLAGIEAIDVALMVVAADEGWMPQSEEHLAVLDLLGVERGVVALTKVDRVDPELVELAALEVEEHLAGTTLEGAPIVPVSAPTGRGIDEVIDALSTALETTPPHGGDRPRLWIDRAFSVSGAGTVVTGTLLGGPLRVGQQVAIWPGSTQARIRSLQSHEQETETALPGRRVAVNLAGLDRAELERGAMLGLPDDWRPATKLAAVLRPARYIGEIENRGAYHLHLGSGAWPVRVRRHGDDLYYLHLETPLCTQMGDRFILRETGRRLVVGGGRVLLPDPPRPSRLESGLREHLEASLDAGTDARAEALLAVRGRVNRARLVAHSGGGTPRHAVALGSELLHPEVVRRMIAQLARMVDDYHRDHPLRPGFPLAEAGERLRLGSEEVADLVAGEPSLDVEGAVVRRASFHPELDPGDEQRWKQARRMLEEAGTANVPRVAELGLESELLHALAREGRLVRVGADLAFLPDQVEELLAHLRSFEEPFTVSEFKDRAGLSRKYAVPFLEWSDAQGITVRMGDHRRVR